MWKDGRQEIGYWIRFELCIHGVCYIYNQALIVVPCGMLRCSILNITTTEPNCSEPSSSSKCKSTNTRPPIPVSSPTQVQVDEESPAGKGPCLVTRPEYVCCE